MLPLETLDNLCVCNELLTDDDDIELVESLCVCNIWTGVTRPGTSDVEGGTIELSLIGGAGAAAAAVDVMEPRGARHLEQRRFGWWMGVSEEGIGDGPKLVVVC